MSWPTVRLGDVATLRNGLNFSRLDEGIEFPIIGVGDFLTRDVIDDKVLLTSVRVAAEPPTEALLSAGDLLFVRSNGSRTLVGRCVTFTRSKPTAFSGFTIRARVNSTAADPEYVGLAARSPLFGWHLRKLGRGSSINNLSQSAIESFEFPLPPLAEQRKIAEILHAWDDAIDRSQRRLELARGKAQTVAAHLFADASWTLNPLSTLTDRVQRKTDGGTHPLMMIGSRTGFIAQDDRYDRNMAGASAAKYTLLQAGEFAYNRGNSLTYPQGCVFQLEEASALVPSIYFSFRIRSGSDASFYRHYFRAGLLNQQLKQIITSGARGNGLLNVSAENFFAIQVPNPSLDAQRQIGACLDHVDAEIALLERKVELLRRQKRGLAQKLLTGEVRVPLGNEVPNA